MCRSLVALSVMVICPVKVPVVVGVKATLTVQPADAASDVPQVLPGWANPVPVVAILVMLNDALPVFVRVTVCAALVVLIAWLPNATLVGERLTAGASALAPVPETAALCGEPAALSEIVMV